MKKILSGVAFLLLWIFTYLLGAGFLQAVVLFPDQPLILWIFSIIGVALSALLVWFYDYLYKGMKRHLEGLNSRFQLIWGPLVLYVVFMIFQFVFPIEASTNQQAVISFVKATPIQAFLNIVIFAPILEEYIFRGLFRSYLFPEIHNNKQALIYCVVSSVAFSLLHMPNTVIHFSIYFVMGFSFAWLYLAKNDLRYSISLHMLNNIIGFISILML